MMTMVIMMIKNWLHFGYSDSDMQGERSVCTSACPEPQHEGHQGEIICIERLGGLLKSYHRKAA